MKIQPYINPLMSQVELCLPPRVVCKNKTHVTSTQQNSFEWQSALIHINASFAMAVLCKLFQIMARIKLINVLLNGRLVISVPCMPIDSLKTIQLISAS